jgi:two-component system response regulator
MSEKLVLQIEDNESDILLTQRALKKCNLRIRLAVARDGVEALDYLFFRGIYANREPKQNPVLVLLDLKLPFIDGLEVLSQIRANTNTRHYP